MVVAPVEEEPQVEEKKAENCDYDILVVLDRTKEMTFQDKDAKLSKINTICNTLALNNLEEKCKDLEKVVDS